MRRSPAHLFVELLENRRFLSLPTLWTTVGPGGGGSYFSGAVNGQDLWIASDMSGVYHSKNFGQNWQQLNFHTGLGGINGGTPSQAQFTSDPNILYIPSSNLSVAKSTNGGQTWSKLTGWAGGTAYWMFTDQTTTTRLLVASATKLYISTNGGSSFTSVYTSASGNLFVAGALFDGSNIYVGTNKGLLVSTNGGTSFALSSAQLASGQYMTSFTGAKEGTTTRLLAISSTTNPDPVNIGISARSYGFSKLSRLDVGGSWVDQTNVIPSGKTPRWVQMARNNISTVYVAGKDANSYPQVIKSVDGGNSFTDVFFTSTSDGGGVPNKNTSTSYFGLSGDFDWGWNGWPWTFVVDNDDANRVFFGNSGSLDVTSDGGATWHQVDVNPADENPAGQSTPKGKTYRTAGADDTSVHYLNWANPNTIVASFTDTIGWRSTDGGNSWAAPKWYTTGGNGDNNTIYKTESAPDGKLYGASSSVHDMYQSNYLLDSRTNSSIQNGRVVVSTDQGANWSLIHEFGHPVVWEQLDPNNANRMYAMVVDGPASSDAGVAGGIWVTNNLNLGASSTWTKLANPPRTQGHPYILRVLNDGTLVATYSGRRFDDGTGEKFTDSSGVFVSTDNGATWIDRSAANMHWYTKEVTIDPTDPAQNTWYVSVNNGWSGTGNDLGDLYRTTNRGVTWTKMGLYNVISGAISIDINSVTINPATKEMYVATGTKGVLYTPDVTVSNLSWSNFSDVTSFPHAWVERVFINPNNPQDVWVASFGGGIKRGGVAPSALVATSAGSSKINLAWADNSANEAGFEIDRATDANFTQNVVTTTAPPNATSAVISGLNPSTTYYFRIRAVNGDNKSANSASTSTATTAIVSVTSSQFLYATSPNQLSITFNTDVGAGAFSVSSLSMTDSSSATAMNPTAYAYNSATRTGTWTLPAPLPDGSYHAVLAAGNVLSADYAMDTFVLTGDADHSGAIDSIDFNALASNFEKTSGATFDQGDFNYDGRVNALDFNALATKFGQRAGAAPIFSAAPVASSAMPDLFATSRVDRDNPLLETV